MGLFDIVRSLGALSQQGPIANPTTQQQMIQATDPRNMSMGRKMGILSTAFGGGDVQGQIDDWQGGIRDRFRERQGDIRTQQIHDDNLLTSSQNRENQSQLMTQRADLHPLNMTAKRLGNQGTMITNAYNRNMNPLLVDQQRKMNEFVENTQGNLVTATNRQNAIISDQQGTFEWVGDSVDGRLMRTKPDGSIVDVTDNYSDKVINAYKSQVGLGKAPIAKHPVTGKPITKTQQKGDEAYMKRIQNMNLGGAAGNVATLNAIAEQLESGADLTGLSWDSPLLSLVRMFDKEGDRGLRNVFDAEGINTQQLVARVIQENLRATLGAQFTQKEGLLLIERSYNPNLSEAQNSKRLRAAAAYTQGMIDLERDRQTYFNTHNTLAGFDNTSEARELRLTTQLKRILDENGGTGATGTSAPQVGTSPADIDALVNQYTQ